MSSREIWQNLYVLVALALGLGLAGNWMAHPEQVAARQDLYLFWSGVLGMALTLVGMSMPLPVGWWALRRFSREGARGPMALLWATFSVVAYMFLYGMRHHS